MSKGDFLPHPDRDYLAWHDNFIAQLTTHRDQARVSETELAEHVSDNQELHAKLSALDIAAAAHRHATAEKDSIREASEARVRASARRLKVQTEYTHAFGTLLAIEGAEITTDLSSAKPSLVGIDHTGGVVVLRACEFFIIRGDKSCFGLKPTQGQLRGEIY